MNKDELDKILANHRAWLKDHSKGQRADLSEVDLIGADLSSVDLSGADLHYADLHYAVLRGSNLANADLRKVNLVGANLANSDLSGADLCGARLDGANLFGADLSGARLQYADLCVADLCVANLGGVNLDFSAWPLCCKSLSPRIDKRIAAQLLYHTLRAMQSCAEDPDVAAVLASQPCLQLANQFHRVGECGPIHPPAAKQGGNESHGNRQDKEKGSEII